MQDEQYESMKKKLIFIHRNRIIIGLLLVFLYLVYMIYIPKEKKIDFSGFQSSISLDREWEVNLNFEIEDYKVLNNRLYIISKNKDIVIIDDKGLIEKKITLDEDVTMNNLTEYFYFDENIVIYDDDVVFIVNTNDQSFRTIEISDNSIGLYLYKNTLFYLNQHTDKIIAKDIYTDEVLWEFYNGDDIGYSVYGTKNYLIIEDKSNGYVYTINPETFEFIFKNMSVLIKQINVDGQRFYSWGLEGEVDNDVKHEFGKGLYAPIKNFNEEFNYVVYKKQIHVYDKNYHETSVTSLPYKVIYNMVFGDYILLNNHSNPISLFDPIKQEIVWIDDNDTKWSSSRQWGKSLVICYKNGYIKKLRLSN